MQPKAGAQTGQNKCCPARNYPTRAPLLPPAGLLDPELRGVEIRRARSLLQRWRFQVIVSLYSTASINGAVFPLAIYSKVLQTEVVVRQVKVRAIFAILKAAALVGLEEGFAHVLVQQVKRSARVVDLSFPSVITPRVFQSFIVRFLWAIVAGCAFCFLHGLVLRARDLKPA